jgi:glycosyltransferase involved in cell wall biosynthesis
MQWQLRRAQNIIAVSEFSKNDAIAKCGVSGEKIIRSYNGIVGLNVDGVNEIERKNDLLYVATFEARKNHETLMKALAAIERPLNVTFVGRDHGLLEHTQGLAEQLEERHGMKFAFIESTDEASLAELYRTTKTYVCPSVLEGFGMPLVEALVSNCNVACSDISVFHEVCGANALYFDPHDAAALARALQESLELPPPDYAQAYAQKFSWDTITHELLCDVGCLPP